MSRSAELLAPAGSMEALTAALRCGADAVYAGAEQFSARANAENFDAAGLAEAARRCHLYGAKLYLAVNTLIFDTELSALDALLGLEGKNGQNDCEQGGDSLHGYGSWFFAVPLCKNKASGRVRRPCQSNFTNYLYRKRLMLIFGVFSKGTSTVSTLAILL